MTIDEDTDFRDLRFQLGLTQEALGKKITASPRQIRKWEAGTVFPRPVYLKQLQRLAKRHGITDTY